MRFIVMVFCGIGASVLCTHLFPRSAEVAFQVAGMGITWVAIVVAMAALFAYKTTK